MEEKDLERFMAATSEALRLLGGSPWLQSAVISAGDTLTFAESASIVEGCVRELEKLTGAKRLKPRSRPGDAKAGEN